MRSVRCGLAPRSSRRFRHQAERAAALSVLLTLAACAAERPPQQSAQYAPAYQHSFGDRAPSYSAEPRPRYVETEADGLPAQPPPMQRKAEADDPREPWSPNYGSVPGSRAAVSSEPHEPAKVVAAVRPQRAPLVQRQSIDADDVVRRAIAEHEMRRED